jgi:hypothetical protein
MYRPTGVLAAATITGSFKVILPYVRALMSLTNEALCQGPNSNHQTRMSNVEQGISNDEV